MVRMYCLWLMMAVLGVHAGAVTLEQVISREHPNFNCELAHMVVGRDGMVYLSNSAAKDGFMMRLDRDGGGKLTGSAGWAVADATANAEGIVATANGHFGHKVVLYQKDFTAFATVDDFKVGDDVGWDAPAHVEAGASGDFYGMDKHRDRILRISPAGKTLQIYQIPRNPAGPTGLIEDFRVCETQECFLLLPRAGGLRCVGFDGQTRWTYDAGVKWNFRANYGGFDIDENGTVYTMPAQGDAVVVIGPDGKIAERIKLQMGNLAPTAEQHIADLRVFGHDLLLKRTSATEIFQRYDLASGALRVAVPSQHERLAVTYPTDVWEAGSPQPFTIEHTANDKASGVRWHVWARPFGAMEYRELRVADGAVQVPADCAGLYQVKVSPEVQPWQRKGDPDYLVRGVVEIRQPGTKGSASISTADNRMYYGRGEEIPFTVILRGQALPTSMTVRLLAGQQVLAERQEAVAGQTAAQFVLPAALTAALRPGRYTLAVQAAGLSGVPQPLEIGPGMGGSPFLTMQYGDYRAINPTANAYVAPDEVAAQAERLQKLGINCVVDRLGSTLQLGSLSYNQVRGQVDPLVKRLEADPLATAPQKARIAPAPLQAMAASSAYGVHQMPILMMNDAGLPIGGPGFDGRKPDQLVADLTTATKALLPYPSFRGWIWSSNWWVFGKRGADAAATPEEKAAYLAAVKQARETGAWSPVLDTVSNVRLGFAVDAQHLFNTTLKGLAPGKITASAAPYRNVESYPPITLGNVDESDLQAQWEQLAVPYASAYGVDFYKRPGKRAWGHPEVWNDAGTGEQILPTLFQLLMRGADGVGFSGVVPNWQAPDDPRTGAQGTASIYRALHGTLKEYGPWLASLQSHDQVAIVASGRMFRIDEWTNVMGRHFARMFEAYISCLHAHYPASVVFVEDMTPETLKRYKAVLVVGQTVEMEPALAIALRSAQAAGVKIFYDGTCREDLMHDFTPLGVAFDKVEKDPHPASDDGAYWRIPAICLANAPAVRAALGRVLPPTADTANPEILFSERTGGDGRYLFVVNNTSPDIEPGQLWRTTLSIATRIPVVAPITLPADATVVYDVFALTQVTPQNGIVQADLRTLPGRIYALLPAAIGQVALAGKRVLVDGMPCYDGTIAVQDATGKALRANLPVSLRLLAGDGQVLEALSLNAKNGSCAYRMHIPLGISGTLTLEATELVSGKYARQPITAAPPTAVASIAAASAKPAPATVVATATGFTVVGRQSATVAAAETAFGPHVRDLAVVGPTAVLAAMNWDHNLYGVDLATGKTTWRQRAGHYFAFNPQAAGAGVAVQGFDYLSAEGYHLYLAGADGKLARRFPLYGLPKRLPHRIAPGMVRDQICNFATAPDGGWVASAGDLGLVVWNRDGKRLWSLDWWKQGDRHTATLAALEGRTLLAAAGMTVTAYEAATGAVRWTRTLAPTGEVQRIAVNRDGTVCALLTTADGGQVFLLRNGQPAGKIITDGNALAITPDGTGVAVATGNQVNWYTANGLLWSFSGDDTLRSPRISADGARLVVASDLGSVYVLSREGQLLLERDMGALTVPAWLPDGDLLLATWMGVVTRLDGTYTEKWRTRLQPEAADMRGKLLTADGAPSAALPTWGNAVATPGTLTPNMLTETKAIIKFVGAQPHLGFQGTLAQMTDGKPDAPAEPWLHWNLVGWLAEGSPFNYILLDTFRTQVRATGITFMEDPAHPESWLRDASIEYWNPATEQWVAIQPLLSNSAVHTHVFATPVEAARFRIILPWGVVGNLRFGEIVLHGEALGASHPDVVAKRPVAVLFDENDDDVKNLSWAANGIAFQFDSAFSGGRALSVAADKRGDPLYRQQFGHTLPNWDFEIVENPQAGQYRYLQFAWKGAPGTTGIALRVNGANGSITLYAGEPTMKDHTPNQQVAGTVPTEWTQMRVDLWEIFKRPVRIQAMSIAGKGGVASFDRVLLGRTEADLPAVK